MANFRIPKDYKKSIKRSNFDLDRAFRGTIKSCCNIPVYCKTLKPGDKFDVETSSKLMSEALVKPLLGDFVLRFAWFKSSHTNYYSWLDNNSKKDSQYLLSRSKHYISGYPVSQEQLFNTSGGSSIIDRFITDKFIVVTDVVDEASEAPISFPYESILPIMTHSAYLYASRNLTQREFELSFGVQKSSLLDYIGITPGYVVPDALDNTAGTYHNAWGFNLDNGRYSRTFDAMPLLVYLDSVRNYMVSNQADTVPYDFNPLSNVEDGERLHLADIDRFFQLLRMEDDGVDIAKWLESLWLTRRWSSNYDDDSAMGSFGALRMLAWFCNAKYYGLFNALSAPDLMQNLLRKTSSSDISVTVDNGQFTINNLRFQNKLQRLVERFDISGGRVSSWLRTVWGQDSPKDLDIPDMIKVSLVDIGTNMVLSTANTLQASGDGATGSPVGEMSGFINQFASNQNRDESRGGFDFYVNNEDNVDCTIMCICSLVPKVDYFQGVSDELAHTMMADDYVPEFDNLGFQDVPFGRYNMLTRMLDNYPGRWAEQVVGKEVAWLSMMTDVNRVHGELSNNGVNQQWALLRRYDHFDDDFYYLYPGDFQYMFELNSPGADNYTLQVGFKVRAVRPKGQSYMPTLEN